MNTAVEEDYEFPRPPQTSTDQEGRTVTIEAYAGDPAPLVEMYTDFDMESRSQGLPPRSEDAIREWVQTLLEEGSNVVVWHETDDASDDDTDGREAVGHAVLVPYNEKSELAIFVHPAYQSAGIGSQLIRVLLGHGQAQGVESVWLSVAQSNHIARRLYESVGFETTSRDRVEQEMERHL